MDRKSTQEIERIERDPVLWAEHHLGEKPRWYQEQILRHPHNRIVLRCGRRLGKCIAGTQRMLNPLTGAYETLDDLYKQQTAHTVLSVTDDYRVQPGKVLGIEDNGVKPVFAVTLNHGSEVHLTGNHPVLTVNGWKEVDALRVGESIATPKATNVFGTYAPGLDRARMLGYLTGGYKDNKSGPTLTIRDDHLAQDIMTVAGREGVFLAKKSKQQYFFIDEGGTYADMTAGGYRSVPDEVYTYNEDHLKAFLAAFYDLAGWTYVDRIPEIGFSTIDKAFAQNIKHLMLRFGMNLNLMERKMSGKTATQALIYSREDALTFCETLAPHAWKDYTPVAKKANEMTDKKSTLPVETWPHIESKRKALQMKKYEVVGNRDERMRMNDRIPAESARRYADNMQDPFLYDLVNGDIDWQEIARITPLGNQQTYDVMVPETHNLLIEDIFVHNTWTMAAHMLWAAFTGMGGKIPNGDGAICVVATPYDSQAKLIFDQLRKFISSNEVLNSSIASMTKNPYHIEFKNGGMIKLFTAGTRSGAEGASLRGQTADSLYMDKHFVPLRREAYRITV